MTPFEQVTLQTPRLSLRFLDQDDAPALLTLFTDAETLRYFSCTPWQHLDQAVEHITQTQQGYRDGSALRLALTLDNQLIGSCTLYAIDRRNHRCEMGYILAREHWGKGYMAEALAALLDYAFGPLALHRLEADIHPDNIASKRLLQRLHFKQEGHLRERWFVGDEISDSIIYGLLAREWKAAIHPAQ
jgi:RimJ/RimL family protein N-acetyltransferase